MQWQEVVNYDQSEKKLIQRAYQRLIRTVKGKTSEEGIRKIRGAFEFASIAHFGQRRKSGEPYVLHVIEVARIAAKELGLGTTSVIAALLHDVVDDTDTELSEIYRKFGNQIGLIVGGLTKLDGTHNSLELQAENFKKILSSLIKDARVILIKMSDRLHNLRTIEFLPKHIQLKLASETSFIYTPLAYRLGLYSLKTEFEDICLKVTKPDVYNEIARKLDETKVEREKFIRELIKPLKKKLNKQGIKARIFGRAKSIASIENKIRKKFVPFEEVYDLFAIRIVVDVPIKDEKSTCWKIYSIITDVYKPVTERLRDWISIPKSNGYESLHTTILGPEGKYVEVQIRSERMDEIAERGFAAHWKYKGMTGNDDLFDSWLNSIRETLDNQESNAAEFLNDFKTNLFNEEIYVYTPNGDLKILPKGATALDFAFSIHTDIGYHCTAIKVNKKLVPLGYKLQNGDQIHVTTSKNQRPNESWLKMVVTGKARSKIRSSMKEERRKQGIIGKEALERKLKGMKADFEENVDFLVKYFNLNSRVDLYFEIAMEQIGLQDFKERFKVENGKLIELEEKEPVPEAKPPLRSRRKKFIGKPKLLINGESADGLDYNLANCCNPVMGDDVFAYTTINSGLKIHRTTCPNATNLMGNYGYRVLKAEWVSSTDTSFIADLMITGIDDGPGVIERLSHHISTGLGLNIRSFSIEGNEGYFEGKISLLVANKDQLVIAIKALENLSQVSTVTRIES